MMRALHVGICLIVTVCCTVSARAQQRPGKFSLGAAVTSVQPPDADVESAIGVGLTVGRIVRQGWGLTGALNWYEPDLRGGFAGVDETIGRLRVRPMMGGVNYTFMAGRLAISPALVAGPSFNRLRLRDVARDRIDLVEGNHGNSVGKVAVAVRPGVNLSYAVTPRVAVTGFGGYLFNRPEFTFRTPGGELRKRWKADAIVLSTGVAVALF